MAVYLMTIHRSFYDRSHLSKDSKGCSLCSTGALHSKYHSQSHNCIEHFWSKRHQKELMIANNRFEHECQKVGGGYCRILNELNGFNNYFHAECCHKIHSAILTETRKRRLFPTIRGEPIQVTDSLLKCIIDEKCALLELAIVKCFILKCGQTSSPRIEKDTAMTTLRATVVHRIMVHVIPFLRIRRSACGPYVRLHVIPVSGDEAPATFRPSWKPLW